MSTSETAIDEVEGTQAEYGETVVDRGPTEHEHPTDWVYVKIAIILAVITAAEIALYFVEDELSSTIVVPSLLAMMVAKFLIVVGWFMHLRYDDPIFKRVFYAGLLLAIAVFAITFTVFEFWTDDYFRFLRS
jgi:cytochrome c oxidase subunit IV